jgi:hypothetical protein
VPADLQAAAQEHMGALRLGARRELRLLGEQLGEAEEVRAMGLATYERRSTLVAATDRGVHLVRRPRLGRRVARLLPWEALESVDATPSLLALTFAGEIVELRFVVPYVAFRRLADVTRRQLGDGPSRDALDALARRKLGRTLTYAHRNELDLLADRLEDGEEPQRLASARLEFEGLLVVTDRRVLLVKAALRRGRERLWSVARADVRGAEPTETGLRLHLADEPVELRDVAPADRREELLAVFGEPPAT